MFRETDGTEIQTWDEASETLMALHQRLALLAKVIGPAPSTAACEDLSDDDREALALMLREAGQDAYECFEWARRAEPQSQRHA